MALIRIVKNITSGPSIDVPITDLAGLIIPAGGQVDLLASDFKLEDLSNSIDLVTAINSGKIIINNGADLNAADSIRCLNSVTFVLNPTNGRLVSVDANGNIVDSGELASDMMRAAGTRAMAGALNMSNHKITSVTTPSDPGDAATKAYVDSIAQGVDWQESVLSRWDASGGLPLLPPTGARYLCKVAGNGWALNHIYQYNGVTWDDHSPNKGWTVWVEDENQNWVYSATSWVVMGSTLSHHDMQHLTDFDDHSQYLNDSRHTAITNNPHDTTLQKAYDGESGSGAGYSITPSNNKPIKIDASGVTFAPLELVPKASVPTTGLANGQLDNVGDLLYKYDTSNSRNKWLSVGRIPFVFSRRGNAQSIYLRVGGDVDAGNSGIRLPRNATLVAVTAQSSGGNVAIGIRVRKNNGTDVHIFNLTGGAYSATNLNVDLSVGDYLNVWVDAGGGGGAVNNPVVYIEIAWRV